MISAIILAAGQSKRMGQPKMLLPWGSRTVIEQVVITFLQAGIEDILVVTGGAREQVESAIAGLPVREIHNPDYATGDMLSSLQHGIRELGEKAKAALIGLGDQPQIQASSIRFLCDMYKSSKSNLVVPSFSRKRGHPWLVSRSLWGEILGLKPSETLRDFLNGHADEIQYVNMDTPTVLADLDTPEDYENSRP
jgi:molybdenum cofactor cytidylyltransferase